MKKILVVSDINSTCNCALNVAIPIFADLGINCCPLPTAIYSNPKNMGNVSFIDCTQQIADFINSWKVNDTKFDGAMTGFMLNNEQVEAIKEFIKYSKMDNVLVDPVIGDDGYVFSCFNQNYINEMKELIKYANIITPNLTELCVLNSEDYEKIADLDINDRLHFIEKMSKNLGKTVITTGILVNDNQIYTTIYDGVLKVFKTQKIGGRIMGTGDIFSSIVFGKILNGCSKDEAISFAINYISNLIEENINSNTYDSSYGLTLKKI